MGILAQKNHTNISKPFKIGGLIFDSKDDYLEFKSIDFHITQTVELVKDGSIDIYEFFNRFKKINVRECYYDAAEELDGLFENATELLCYEGTRFQTDYKVGCCFFDKINVIKYHSESESESDDEVEIRLPDSESESESESDDEVEIRLPDSDSDSD